MKRKIFSILFALVLVLSFSLVMAVPAAAIVGSTFTVTDGTYSTTPTGTEPYQTGNISATLTGSWPDSAVIGDFTATGTGGLYLDPPYAEWGTTANIDVSGTLSADAVTFEGEAIWVSGDDITDDEVTGITGTVTIYADGNFVAALTGMASTDLGPLACTLDISGSMLRPITNARTAESFFTIQDAINVAVTDDIISVGAGEYAGAIVNEDLTIIGAVGGASIITSGVPYKSGSGLTTGFRLDEDADGAEIRNFTINGDYANSFYFAVFARNADSVIVDSLTVDTMRQGITSWGGSGWQITNNVLNNTFPQTEGSPTGGGIAIYLGGDPTDFPHCDNNLVQGNTIATSAEQSSSFIGSAICLWFDMRNLELTALDGTESVTGNQIIGNSITASGLENQVGISTGVGGLDGDNNPDKVAACLGIIHDNTVTNNTVDNAEWGLYLYVTTNLTVQGNTIKNCSDCGIYMKDDHANCLINYNNIHGNTNYGLNNTDGVTYGTTVDATKNWWGHSSGPDGAQVFGGPETYIGVLPGTGDKVSANVDCRPWLTRKFQTVLGDNIAYFGISAPALKGWNIVSVPLALDANVTAGGFATNTWGGLINLGKRAEDDDFPLKLHYTLVEGVRFYTPIYYYDSNPDSPDFGWREATVLTELNPVDAFYIRMMASDSIPILFSPDLSVPSKELYHGWNLVGCAYMDMMFKAEGQGLKTALATIATVSSPAGDVKGYAQVVSPPVNQPPWIFMQTPEGGTYIPEGADGVILIGKGYWVFMENPGTLAGLTFTPISLPQN